MMNVAVSTNIPIGSLEKLCPASELRWGNCAFTLNPSDRSSFDYWIIWAGLVKQTTLQVAPRNTLFIAGEPPAKKVYPRRFYQQFHQLVCAKGDYPHDHVHSDALGLNWHLGYDRATGQYAYGYDRLASMPAPDEKQNKVSVVCSNLSTTQGQRDRLALLTKLKEALGDQIVHFGRGFVPIEDKLDAILPYRYHLVLENSISDDYWTEKLSDAYLGWALPLYVGCKNIDRYVPSESLVQLTGQPMEATAQRIRQQLGAGLSGTQHAALAEARDAILNRYNPFARFAYWSKRLYKQAMKHEPVTIQPHKAFRTLGRGLLYRAKQRIRGA